MSVGLLAFCWATAWAVDETEIGAGVSMLPIGTPADAVVPTPGQPWRFFRWRFICVVRLSTLWHTGHWVVPLCIFMCLYIESRFQNDLPQSLHVCDGCSMTTVCESKSDTNGSCYVVATWHRVPSPATRSPPFTLVGSYVNFATLPIVLL